MAGEEQLPAETQAFYCAALERLQAAGVPVLVGGAYAFGHYTGIIRHTKDFDLMLREADVRRALEVCAAAGWRTELTSPAWIGKVFHDDAFVDFIFCSANGLCPVDDDWFAEAVDGEVFSRPCRFVPPEEILWPKAFVADRLRYDGADVAHLIHACATEFDWPRLIARFGPRWPVLLSHCILFSFVYPAERALIPGPVWQELIGRFQDDLAAPPAPDRVCNGPILSRSQYLPDVEEWGYEDGRVQPWGNLTAEEVAELTAATKQEV